MRLQELLEVASVVPDRFQFGLDGHQAAWFAGEEFAKWMKFFRNERVACGDVSEAL